MFLNPVLRIQENEIKKQLCRLKVREKLVLSDNHDRCSYKRQQLLEDPDLMEQFETKLLWNRKASRNLNKNILLLLNDISWFLDKEQRGLVQAFTLENWNKYHLDDDLNFSIRFESQVYYSIYLSEKIQQNPSAFFGSIMQEYEFKYKNEILLINLIEILSLLELRFDFVLKRTPKVKQRRKGYNDHGSLGTELSQTLKQQSNDFYNIQLHDLKQQEKQIKEDTLEFLKGLLM